MASITSSVETSINNFFHRAGLDPQDRLECESFIRTRYPEDDAVPVSRQGYCSLTVLVERKLVIQFRPHVYRLHLPTAQAASRVYGRFAPTIEYLGTLPNSGLLIYSMNRIDGIPLKDLRSTRPTITQSVDRRKALCKDFAGFLAEGWHKSKKTNTPLGMVGLSLVSRLKSLITDLPLRFQSKARHVLRQLHRIEALPWVFTHGDIIAANIMVDPKSCQLHGLVDWAEAECLPFGVCFYGLEEILGEMTSSGFRYCPDAAELRKGFWAELQNHVPEMQQDQVLEAVKLARDLGVLLWHGIAFDNGAINRVVQEGRDIEEIHRLDTFLDTQEDHDLLERGHTTPYSSSMTTMLPASAPKNYIPAQ